MSRAVGMVIRLGDAVDAVAAAVRSAPSGARQALAVRRYRRIAVATALVYLLVYLIAIQDIAISASGQYGRFASPPSIEVVPDWTNRVFASRAPFLYEPILTIYPLAQLAVLLSPGNMLVGLILGVLLGLNVAVPLHARSLDPACRRNRFAGTFGALPGLLLGFSCCAPTLILLLGTNAAAAILPVFIPLRELLFPLAVGLMTVMLVWTARTRPDRARDRHGDADERAAVPARRPQARASSF